MKFSNFGCSTSPDFVDFSPTMECFLEEGKQLHDECSTLVLVSSFNFSELLLLVVFPFYQLNQSSRRFLRCISLEWFECL